MRCDVHGDFEVTVHPGLQAQALVAMGGYWLDLVESLGGGGLEFVVTSDQSNEVCFQMHLTESYQPTQSLEMPLETAEVVLARRHLLAAGASLRHETGAGELPTLKICWPCSDIPTTISRKETHVS